MAFCFAGLFLPGCTDYTDPRVPERIRPQVEPERGGHYLFYRPASYDRRRSWPVVVVCHSSFPDSPDQQIRHWTELAEERGFLVIAPKLNSASRSALWDSKEPSDLGRQGEQAILGALQHVRAGHTIAEDRIFLYGWSGGAQTALQCGLRHPEIFRAISLSRPAIEASILLEASAGVDHHQPVQLNYQSSHVVHGKAGRECADRLRALGVNLRVDSIGSVNPNDTRRAVSFFEEIIRKEPWIVIHADVTQTDPLEIRFKLRCSFVPAQYRWTFGDGDESPIAEPAHRYARGGAYTVAVAVVGKKNGEQLTRNITITVPAVNLRPTPAP